MPPQDLVETLQQNGQMNVVMADLLRGKTLSYVLSKSTVVDTEGNEIDMSDFVPDFDAKSEEQTEEA